MQMFTVFVTTLLTQFEDYLSATSEPDMMRDQVGYRQVSLWLTDEELAEMSAVINAAVLKVIHNQPGEGRTRRLLSSIIMPDVDTASPQDDRESDSDGNDTH